MTGYHTSVACAACHTKGYVVGQTTNTCYSCHTANYTAAANHVAQSYPTDCTLCHSTTNFTTSTFNHATTPFPLTGFHKSVLCATCHTKGYAVGQTSAVCSSCHLTNYNSTTTPNHTTNKFPTTCDQCHNTTAWVPSIFNHATTPFPLTGYHTSVACAACHTKGYVVGQTTNTCYSCHTANYTSAANHVAQSYPTDCTLCHSTTNFTTSTFNHATTPFPLTGFHTTVLCATCHTKGFAVGQTSSLCSACHIALYNSTTNPVHSAAKFPTTCDQCHSTTNWTSSTYNHDALYFPINSGRHNGAWTLCSDCHNNATNYAVFTCIACHQHSSQSSVNSNHGGVKGYTYTATSCYSCHPKGNAG